MPFTGIYLLFYGFFRSDFQTWLNRALTSGFPQATTMVSVGCILTWRHLGKDLLPSLFRLLEEIIFLWLYDWRPRCLIGCGEEATLSSQTLHVDSCHLNFSKEPLTTWLQGGQQDISPLCRDGVLYDIM